MGPGSVIENSAFEKSRLTSSKNKEKGLDPKVPKGPRRGREIPLIGVADVSLRGLGSPKEGEQKTFWSPSLAAQQTQKVRMSALILFEELTAFDFLEY